MLQVSDTNESLRTLETLLGFPISGFVKGTVHVPPDRQLPLPNLKQYLASVMPETASSSGEFLYLLKYISCRWSRGKQL